MNMNRKVWICVMTMLICSLSYAQDSLQATIVLIGDAGQLTGGRHPVVNAVRQHVPMNKKTTIVYLGDNLYKVGLPDNSVPNFAIAKAALDSQIHIAGKNPVNIFFIPGNHDWANGKSKGYQSILRVQSYIDQLGNKNVRMFPRDGCPGPEAVSITDDITLVMMDSQWWIHDNDKPGIESDCPTKTQAEVLVQLEDILSKNDSKLVILAMHHPFRTYGQHGGYFTLKQHIFPFTDAKPNLYIPLPVLGSIYPLTRAVFGTSQDLKHPLYQRMITSIESVVKGHPNVIFVSGHEHTLQLIKDSGYHYIVSGSGSKTSRVSKSSHTMFASPENGYVTLEVSKKKNVVANYFTVKGDTISKAYTQGIMHFSKPPAEKQDSLREVDYTLGDKVVISASDQYKYPNGFRKFVLGSNYRKEWGTPIEMKTFHIKEERGGFTIKSLGGGKQTKSLKLVDKNGHEWVLRTVDKDPEKALPSNLRGTVAQKIVQDMISASHPYSLLVVPDLARAVDIYTPEPEFFFVPDDPAFGYYRPLFANTVCILEDREPASNISESKSTGKILDKMLDDNEHHVDQQQVLRARLLDMLIGDFDRHADQWRWGTTDTGKGKLYFAIPKDRDQAFFNSDGLLLKYISRFQMPSLEGFKKRLHNVNGFNEVARDFDRAFLNGLDEDDWRSVVDSFQQHISNEVIQKAVSKYPREIKGMDSAITVEKLVSRRDDMMKQAIRYYKFISKQVTVTGSNKREYFHISEQDGKLNLTVYKKDSKTDSATVMYKRDFDNRYTKELRLFGLNGDDKFEIDANVDSRIKVRIIGGKGSDSFYLKGNMRSFVYDLRTEKNGLINMRRANKEFSDNPSVLEYKYAAYKSNKFNYPLLNIGFNAEDKLLLGVGFNITTQGFRKEPFASNHRFSSLFAINRGAFQGKYEGVFNRVIGKNDVIVTGTVVSPTLNNFFGFGNETTLNKSLPITYYRVRFKYAQGELLLRKRINDILHLSLGASYYHYWNDINDNKNRIINNPAFTGIDTTGLYARKNYLGAKMRVYVKYVNNELFPTRGITWLNEFSALQGLNQNSRNHNRIQSDMTIYASIKDPGKLMAVFRLGGGHIFSKDYEYFQAMSIGTNNFVRGFRKNRFAGKSMAYGSTELRYKLFTSKSYILPGDVGAFGFYDLGRVWQPGESSSKWHAGYGGGLYFVPYHLLMISAGLGLTDEGSLFNFTIGTKFNLTF